MGSAGELLLDRLSVDIGGTPLVRGVSLRLAPGSSYGIVGESGSGKSLTSRAILGLLPRHAKVRGSIRLGDRELLSLSAKEMRRVRGAQVAMVFQDPLSALNPVQRVGASIAQVVRAHERLSRPAARARAIELIQRVGIDDADTRSQAYPHEFSGGMRQRIVIAMALASRPSVLLADEPTTALDVMVQAGILRLLDDLRREEGMSLLLVSHDFAVVAGMCARVGVMYAGELVEEGPTTDVLHSPSHPYSRSLLRSLPDEATPGTALVPIPGSPPEPGSLGLGCPFAPRCDVVRPDCSQGPIEMVEVAREHGARCLYARQPALPGAAR